MGRDILVFRTDEGRQQTWNRVCVILETDTSKYCMRAVRSAICRQLPLSDIAGGGDRRRSWTTRWRNTSKKCYYPLLINFMKMDLFLIFQLVWSLACFVNICRVFKKIHQPLTFKIATSTFQTFFFLDLI